MAKLLLCNRKTGVLILLSYKIPPLFNYLSSPWELNGPLLIQHTYSITEDCISTAGRKAGKGKTALYTVSIAS